MAAVEELIVADPDHGEEVALRIVASGREIRTNAGAVGKPIIGADYVRVLDEQGRELAYWTHTEWAEAPVEVLGAILGAAAGCGEPVPPTACQLEGLCRDSGEEGPAVRPRAPRRGACDG